jgi:hypothetical protein
MTKEQFFLLDEYFKSLVDSKLQEIYPFTTDVRDNLNKVTDLKSQLIKSLTSACNDLK